MNTDRYVKITGGLITETLRDPNYRIPEEPNHPVTLRPDAKPRELGDCAREAIIAELRIRGQSRL